MSINVQHDDRKKRWSKSCTIDHLTKFITRQTRVYLRRKRSPTLISLATSIDRNFESVHRSIKSQTPHKSFVSMASHLSKYFPNDTIEACIYPNLRSHTRFNPQMDNFMPLALRLLCVCVNFSLFSKAINFLSLNNNNCLMLLLITSIDLFQNIFLLLSPHSPLVLFLYLLWLLWFIGECKKRRKGRK